MTRGSRTKREKREAEAAARLAATKALELKRRRRRTIIWVALTAVILFVVFGVPLAWPSRPARAAISATFSRTGSVDMQYAGAPTSATSPACGCIRTTPIGTWRGITLPAHHLSISRIGGAGHRMTYTLFNAPNSSWTAGPIALGVELTVTTVDVRDGTDLKVIGSAAPADGPDSRIVTRSHLRTDSLSIVVTGTLHVQSGAREPVAAISVPENGTASLRYVAPAVRPADPTLLTEVSFNPSSKLRGQVNATVDAFPAVDVLGPKISLWGEAGAPDLTFTYATTTIPRQRTESPDYQAAHPQTFKESIKSFEQRSPIPIPAGWHRMFVVQTNSHLFALRLVAIPTAGDGTQISPVGSKSETGHLQIAVLRVVSEAQKLVPIFAAADRNPKMVIRGVPAIPNVSHGPTRPVGTGPGQAEYDTAAETVELPPDPPLSGINVFGSLSSLRFGAAQGELNVGAESARSIAAPTPIEFRNLTPHAIGEHAIIPVSVDHNRARLTLKGSSDVRINGVAIAQHQEWAASLISRGGIERIGACFALAAVVMAVMRGFLGRPEPD